MGYAGSETTRPRGGIEAEHTMRSGLDASMSDDGERADIVDGQKGQDATAAALRKEKDVQVESPNGLETLGSSLSPPEIVEREAQEDSDKTSLSGEQPGSPAPALEASTFDLSGITPNPAHGDGAARFVQSVTSDSIQTATSRNPDRLEDAQQMHHIDIKVLENQLASIRRVLGEVVRGFLECIGDLSHQTCPLELEPSDHLSALYARCLGPNWANVAREYNSFNAFKAPQATMSLVSAFLYNNILAQQAYDPEVIQDVIELLQTRGITGRAAQAVYEFSNRGKSFCAFLNLPELTTFQRKMSSSPLTT